MTMDEKIARINELYHKSKTEGLTEAEKEEQKVCFRAQMALAQRLGAPVIIHDREAHGDVLEIMKEFPDISVTALVRGREVLNDATLSDAKEAGLDDMVKVITNGTGIPGTSLSEISYDAKKAVFDADVIISKGQGNFETLMYSRLNIYYIFMCKCKMFAERFNVEPFTGMLLNDMRMK